MRRNRTGAGCDAGFHGAYLAMLNWRASSDCRMVRKAAPCSPWNRTRRGEMSDQRRESAAPVEPYFDRTPQPFGDGPPEPAGLRGFAADAASAHRELAAKRLVDMRYVSGLDRATAERHFPLAPGGAAGRARVPRRARRPGGARRRPALWRHRRRNGRMRTAALSSAGTTAALASRLSAPRSRGPAMAASSWARTRA
jgi:hypothetical protein